MAILLVTYDLKNPGRNYEPLHSLLKQYNYCKGMESVWLLDTTHTPSQVRERIAQVVDGNDIVFVTKLASQAWASRNFNCADWLNAANRNWA
jgi:CRISPR/Cas system-associated endoribonuclease Cas2